MRLAFCIDKEKGLSFFNKRLSLDRLLIEKLISLSNENKIYLNSYTASQFKNKDNLVIDNDFLNKAGKNDICFLECVEIPIEKADELIIFNFNRVYPKDLYFNNDLSGFKRVLKEDFKGSSHNKITLEIYRRI